MTLIKFDADQALADRMKLHYGQRVASKAFAMAAEDALALSARNNELEDVITAQKLEIRRLQAVIEQARSAAALLLTAQKLEIRRLQAVIEQARSAAALLLEKTSQADAFA